MKNPFALLVLLSPFVFVSLALIVFAVPSWADSYLTIHHTIDESQKDSEGATPALFGFGYYNTDNMFFVNTRMSASNEPYFEDYTTTTFGDEVVERYQEWFGLNAGIAAQLQQGIATYLGAGWLWGMGKAEMYDATFKLASEGTYYVDDPDGDEGYFNINGGVLFSLSTFTLEVGYDSAIETTYFGIGTAF